MLEEISAKKTEQEKAFNLVIADTNDIKVSQSSDFGGRSTPKKTNIKVV